MVMVRWEGQYTSKFCTILCACCLCNSNFITCYGGILDLCEQSLATSCAVNNVHVYEKEYDHGSSTSYCSSDKQGMCMCVV